MYAKPNIKVELVFITPEMAEQMLGGNSHNRQKRRWWIEAMASAMRRGEWITTHQGIAFTASGRLLDGQHRLEAIVGHKAGVWMLVTKGIDDGAFKVIDNGIKRSLADLTNLPKRLAEACRVIAAVMYGGAVSTQQVLDIAKSGVEEIHEELIETCGSVRKYYASAPMRTSAVALVMDGVPKAGVFKIYTDLVHEKFTELPNSAQALIRQVNSGKANAADASDTLARGLKVLNPCNGNLVKIQCSDAEISSAREYTRSIFKRALLTNGEILEQA